MQETAEQRSRIMRCVKSKDTTPELVVRKISHSLGYRHRLYRKDLPGKPDLVFPSRKKIIFVHGCFWHGHKCKRGDRLPKSNRDYWVKKIKSNMDRDKLHIEELNNQGWSVLIVWECEVKNLHTLTQKIAEFING